MTAAVARPPLFRHLVASNPEHEKGSFAATASSVTLHAALVIAAVVLTARVKAPPENTVTREIVPIENYVDPAPPRPSKGGGPTNGLPAPGHISVTIPMPTDVPKVIPPPGSMDNITKALEEMMRAQPSAPNAGIAGTGTGENPEDFVPLTVKPELLNRVEFARAMTRNY